MKHTFSKGDTLTHTRLNSLGKPNVISGQPGEADFQYQGNTFPQLCRVLKNFELMGDAWVGNIEPVNAGPYMFDDQENSLEDKYLIRPYQPDDYEEFPEWKAYSFIGPFAAGQIIYCQFSPASGLLEVVGGQPTSISNAWRLILLGDPTGGSIDMKIEWKDNLTEDLTTETVELDWDEDVESLLEKLEELDGVKDEEDRIFRHLEVRGTEFPHYLTMRLPHVGQLGKPNRIYFQNSTFTGGIRPRVRVEFAGWDHSLGSKVI